MDPREESMDFPHSAFKVAFHDGTFARLQIPHPLDQGQYDHLALRINDILDSIEEQQRLKPAPRRRR